MTRGNGPHVFELGEQGDLLPRDAPSPDPPSAISSPRAPTSRAKAAGTAAPLRTRDVLRDLRARLRVVEREIRARKRLERERDQIHRLLDAARKRADVRQLRATG